MSSTVGIGPVLLGFGQGGQAYDPHLHVGFSPLRGDGRQEADGYDQAE
ncbi:hypothetical protein OG730_40975 [Streptomyces sp. NBC_01298]|nr:hypothetical protein OG730_40975 [Streptomyces sp. NBC_01298]